MNPLHLSSGPHTRDRWTTSFIMRVVAFSLLPTLIVGVAVYGLSALWITLASVVTAVVTEAVFDLICRKPQTWKDGSAVVTGLLLALSLPPNVPLYIPVLGSLFAILVVKCFFGGLGKNFLNPALAGRCFLLISFSKTVSTFTLDGVTCATPLAVLKSGEAVNVTRMFFGTTSGVIGSSILAMLAGGLLLWALDIIHGEICFSVLISFTVFMGLFGGQGFDPGFLLAHLCGGGVVMGAFFMATDYATSPVSRAGQLVYGCLIGILGGLFRCFGGTTDSFSYSIIIANLFVPLIDLYVVPKPFAYRRNAVNRGSQPRSLRERIPVPVVVLAVITLIAGLTLSGVFTITKDTIAEQQAAAKAASYRAVLPEAASFVSDESTDAEIASLLESGFYGTDFGRVQIKEAARGLDASGSPVGAVISVTSSDGYDGDVTLSVGILPDGTLSDIAFTELHETPGMGMLVADAPFKDQFAGRLVSTFILNKSGSAASDEEINTVSGASTTSGAVVNAVNAALDFFNAYMKGGERDE